MPNRLDSTDVRALHRLLLAWYRRVQRPLPWRQDPSLYRTWISEIMLQQTTVQTATPYWQRFLERFPDVGSLAAATEEQVLTLWSGLGYYRRARSLHRAARIIVYELGGRMPEDRDSWLSLPGIGPYTAGAIASIGAGEVVPAVDANARRVLTRWLCSEPAAAGALKPSRLHDVAGQLVHTRQPGAWNQAIMELGALICTASQPRCGQCPVRRYCRAGKAGRAAEIPPAAQKTPPTPVVTHLLAARCRGAFLLWPADAEPVIRFRDHGRPLPRKRPGLWLGLLSLPGGPWYREFGPSAAQAARRADGGAIREGWRRWLAGFDPTVKGRWRDLGLVKHAVTTYRLRCQVTEVVLPRRPGTLARCSWYHPDRDGATHLTALARKALKLSGL